ncbi:hypothetical protein [Paenibacillus polymyxa]|uniref:hypothetical protein n=1 Tax=Paenibacillus polymyxa TaxID=1406 RepID=UPI0016843672|nr:hypothetical protein [Paenibacillus polymyxa]
METAEWSENAIVYIENDFKITAGFKDSSGNASRIRFLPGSNFDFGGSCLVDCTPGSNGVFKHAPH